MTHPSPPSASACAVQSVFHAQSGLDAYDAATFYGAPPLHGPVMRSDFGYAAMVQPRLRRISEVAAEGSRDLVLLMVTSTCYDQEVWMDGRHSGRIRFRRGDLVVVPPGMASRWCGNEGQAGAIHLHVSAARLTQTLAEEPRCSALNLAPGLAFRDPTLQRILLQAARLDDLDPLSRVRVAALGALALLRVLRHPPPKVGAS